MSASCEDFLAEARRLLAADRLSEAADKIAAARSSAKSAPELARAVDTLGALQARRNELRSALDCHLFAAVLAREDRSKEWDGAIAAASPIPDPEAASAHPLLEASFLANAGALAQVADAPAIAEKALSRAAALTVDDEGALAAEVAHNLGVFLMNVSRPGEALPHLRRAAAIDRALGSGALLGDLVRLAAALRRTGESAQRDEAASILGEARSLARGPAATAEVLLEQGSLSFAGGDVLAAMQRSREAVDLLEDCPLETAETALPLGRAYVDLAIYARNLKRQKAALESLERATEAARVAKSPALAAVIARERARWSEK